MKIAAIVEEQGAKWLAFGRKNMHLPVTAIDGKDRAAGVNGQVPVVRIGQNAKNEQRMTRRIEFFDTRRSPIVRDVYASRAVADDYLRLLEFSRLISGMAPLAQKLKRRGRRSLCCLWRMTAGRNATKRKKKCD